MVIVSISLICLLITILNLLNFPERRVYRGITVRVTVMFFNLFQGSKNFRRVRPSMGTTLHRRNSSQLWSSVIVRNCGVGFNKVGRER